MATILENKGCTLPVLDPATKVLHQKWQYKAAAEAGARSMVRLVQPFNPGRVSLDQLLAIADEQFQDVARRCGAQVIGHEWGLYAPASDSLLTDYFSEQVPRNHVLVSRVDVAHNTREITNEQAHCIRKANQDYFAAHVDQPYIWYDSQSREQYINGELRDDQTPRLLIVDIEPRLARPATVTHRFQ